MADDASQDADLDALVEELARLGLVEPYTERDGRIAYRLTPTGARLDRMLTSAGVDAGRVLGTLPGHVIHRQRSGGSDPRHRYPA